MPAAGIPDPGYNRGAGTGSPIPGTTRGQIEDAGINDAGYNAGFRPSPQMHKHLSRLDHVWIESPVYFVTTCTFHRRRILTSPAVGAILTNEWKAAHDRHRWA